MICHFYFLAQKCNYFSLFIGKSNDLSRFVPVISSKRIKNSRASIKSKIWRRKWASPVSRSIPRLLLVTNSMVPGKSNSQEELSDCRSWIPRQVLQLRRHCRYIVQLPGAPLYSLKSDPWWVISQWEEKRPRPVTKLLLSALIIA